MSRPSIPPQPAHRHSTRENAPSKAQPVFLAEPPIALPAILVAECEPPLGRPCTIEASLTWLDAALPSLRSWLTAELGRYRRPPDETEAAVRRALRLLAQRLVGGTVEVRSLAALATWLQTTAEKELLRARRRTPVQERGRRAEPLPSTPPPEEDAQSR